MVIKKYKAKLLDVTGNLFFGGIFALFSSFIKIKDVKISRF